MPCGGGGRNHELAYHILGLCHGDLDAAVQLFLRCRRGFALPAFHPLLTYKYQESESWSTKQLDAFQNALIAHDKDFGYGRNSLYYVYDRNLNGQLSISR